MWVERGTVRVKCFPKRTQCSDPSWGSNPDSTIGSSARGKTNRILSSRSQFFPTRKESQPNNLISDDIARDVSRVLDWWLLARENYSETEKSKRDERRLFMQLQHNLHIRITVYTRIRFELSFPNTCSLENWGTN